MQRDMENHQRRRIMLLYLGTLNTLLFHLSRKQLLLNTLASILSAYYKLKLPDFFHS